MRLNNVLLLVLLGAVATALPKKEGRCQRLMLFRIYMATTRWFIDLVSFFYPMIEQISTLVSNLYMFIEFTFVNQVEKPRSNLVTEFPKC